VCCLALPPYAAGPAVHWCPAEHLCVCLQPLDVSVNGKFKYGANVSYNRWASGQVRQQLADGVPQEALQLDLRQSVIKELVPGWVADGWDSVTKEQVRTSQLCRRRQVGGGKCTARASRLA